MRKIKNIFNKKTLVYLLIFFVFLFLPKTKVLAGDVLMMNFTSPKNNTITTSDVNINDTKFTFTFKVPTTIPPPPNDVDAIYFQPSIDGVQLPAGPSGAHYIFNGKKSDYAGQTVTVSWSYTTPPPFDAKVYSWKIFDYFTKTEYISDSFTYKLNTNYKGFYYIYKTQYKGAPTVFSYSSRFDTEASCTADKNNFLSKDPNSTIYRECQSYDYLPDLTTSEFVNISPGSTRPENRVYKLLAPIGGLTQAPDNLGDYFNKIFLIVIGLCGALAVIMIVIGGVQYMGDESIFSKTEAKSRITSAILGLLIALGSWALLNTINPDLLGKKGLNVQQVSANITDTPLTKESTPVYDEPMPGCPEGLTPIIVLDISSNPIMNVCKSISANVKKLIKTALEKNIKFTGNAYRSHADQIQARKDNGCPNIMTSPPQDCKTPTAIPGTSLHESGLAIDFMCNGYGQFINVTTGPVIRPATKVCWDWMVANASKYGFANFPKENWHWSAGPNAGN